MRAKFLVTLMMSACLASCVMYDLNRDLRESPAAARPSSVEYERRKEAVENIEKSGVEARLATTVFDFSSEKLAKASYRAISIFCKSGETAPAYLVRGKKVYYKYPGRGQDNKIFSSVTDSEAKMHVSVEPEKDNSLVISTDSKFGQYTNFKWESDKVLISCEPSQ